MDPIQLLGSGIAALDPAVTAQRRLNCFFDVREDQDKAKIIVRGTPGQVLFTRLPNITPIRGWHAVNNVLYVVQDRYLYKVDLSGVVSLAATISDNSGYCGMADNGQQLLIADSNHIWIYSITASAIQWTTSLLVPTYVNASSFTLVGDQTADFSPGIQLQLTQSAGSTQTTILSSTFDAGTSMTTVNVITGTVDAGLYEVAIGFIPAPGTLTEVISPALDQAKTNGSTSVAYQDGFFIIAVHLTQQFYVSNSYDGTNWQALQFAAKQSQPDNLVAVNSLNNTLILFGEFSTEFWQNTGGAPFTFRKVSGTSVNYGLMAQYSVAYCNNTLIFLAQTLQGNPQVIMLNGYSPQKVSTSDIDRLISKMKVTADAIATSYLIDGHMMYELTFPSEDRSFLYDALTNMWSEVQTGVSIKPKKHNVTKGIVFNSKNCVTNEDGNISILDADEYTDNGIPIQRVVTSRHIRLDGNQFKIDQIYLDMATGCGNVSGLGTDPQMSMEVSYDYGHTFLPNRTTSMGKIGQFEGPRVLYRRIGASRDYVFRFTVTDPVPFIIVTAAATFQEGNETRQSRNNEQ